MTTPRVNLIDPTAYIPETRRREFFKLNAKGVAK